MIFRFNNKEYEGNTAVEVVRQMECEETEFTRRNGSSLQQFLEWSLEKLSDRLPPRELELSPRVSDEVQAKNYLSLRHDFDLGELIE